MGPPLLVEWSRLLVDVLTDHDVRVALRLLQASLAWAETGSGWREEAELRPLLLDRALQHAKQAGQAMEVPPSLDLLQSDARHTNGHGPCAARPSPQLPRGRKARASIAEGPPTFAEEGAARAEEPAAGAAPPQNGNLTIDEQAKRSRSHDAPGARASPRSRPELSDSDSDSPSEPPTPPTPKSPASKTPLDVVPKSAAPRKSLMITAQAGLGKLGQQLSRHVLHQMDAQERAKQDADSLGAATFSADRPHLPFHPSANARIVWTVFLMLCIAFESILLPVEISFSTFQDTPIASPYRSLVITLVFVTDMLLTANTAIFNASGELVTDRRAIFHEYVRSGHLMIDLSSTIDFSAVLNLARGVSESSEDSSLGLARSVKFGKLLRVLRLLRLLRLRSLMESCIEIFPMWVISVINTVFWFVIFVLALHWCACLWWFTALFDDPGLDYVATVAPWEDAPPTLGLQYLQAFTWSCGVLTQTQTDLAGHDATAAQRWLTIVIATASYMLGLHLVAKWVGMFGHKTVEMETFNFEAAGIAELMRQRGVNSKIQARVRRHMEMDFTYRQKRIMEEARYQVLRRLAPNLRSEFYTALNKQVLTRHPFFAAMPEQPLMRLCEVAEAAIFRAGEIVCRRGHAAETAFFIVTGELVIVFDEDNNLQGINKFDESVVGQIRISAPSWVGDQCLFTEDAKRTCSIKAAINSELLVLSKSALDDPHTGVLIEFPRVRKIYDEMATAIKEGNLVYAGIVCGECGQHGHNVTTCPQVTGRYKKDEVKGSGRERFKRAATGAIAALTLGARRTLTRQGSDRRSVTSRRSIEQSRQSSASFLDFGGRATLFGEADQVLATPRARDLGVKFKHMLWSDDAPRASADALEETPLPGATRDSSDEGNEESRSRG